MLHAELAFTTPRTPPLHRDSEHCSAPHEPVTAYSQMKGYRPNTISAGVFALNFVRAILLPNSNEEMKGKVKVSTISTLCLRCSERLVWDSDCGPQKSRQNGEFSQDAVKRDSTTQLALRSAGVARTVGSGIDLQLNRRTGTSSGWICDQETTFDLIQAVVVIWGDEAQEKKKPQTSQWIQKLQKNLRTIQSPKCPQPPRVEGKIVRLSNVPAREPEMISALCAENGIRWHKSTFFALRPGQQPFTPSGPLSDYVVHDWPGATAHRSQQLDA